MTYFSLSQAGDNYDLGFIQTILLNLLRPLKTGALLSDVSSALCGKTTEISLSSETPVDTMTKVGQGQ